MESTGKKKVPTPGKNRIPLYGSIWMALFFALRREYQLARATR